MTVLWRGSQVQDKIQVNTFHWLYTHHSCYKLTGGWVPRELGLIHAGNSVFISSAPKQVVHANHFAFPSCLNHKQSACSQTFKFMNPPLSLLSNDCMLVLGCGPAAITNKNSSLSVYLIQFSSPFSHLQF